MQPPTPKPKSYKVTLRSTGKKYLVTLKPKAPPFTPRDRKAGEKYA